MAFPYGTALLAVPAAGAVVTAAIPARKAAQARAVAIGTSLVALALSVALLVDFNKAEAGYQFVESKVWIKALGIHYLMGVDGISLFMVVLTGLLFPIALLASSHVEKKVNAYFAVMLTLEAARSELRSVMLVSALPGEGVSTVTLGLAASMADVARQGVLVIDLNSANPSLADRLGLRGDVGLGELLAKDATRAEAIAESDVPRLFLLGRGRASADLSQPSSLARTPAVVVLPAPMKPIRARFR